MGTGMFLQTRDYAARKGTREKALKRKLKNIAEKARYIGRLQRAKIKKQSVQDLRLKMEQSGKTVSPDDVWIGKYYLWKIYPFEEAVECHRETHHPTMYNLPNSNICALIEMNLEGEKKTKVITPFTRVVNLPHKFDHGEERKVLALCASPELQTAVRNAGATFAGGRELIKQIMAGSFSIKEYNYYVASLDILSDLLLIRGLMKKNFPTVKAGTLGPDIKAIVNRFLYGIKYSVIPHTTQKTFGTIRAPFGTLNMTTKQLEENFTALLDDIEIMKPKRKGSFILRTRITCPPSTEAFKIDFAQHLSKNKKTVDKQEDDDEEEDVNYAVIPSH